MNRLNRIKKIARISDSAYEAFGIFIYKTLLEYEKFYDVTRTEDSTDLSPKALLYSEESYNQIKEENRGLREEDGEESVDLPISYDQFRLALERIRVRVFDFFKTSHTGLHSGSMSNDGVMTLYSMEQGLLNIPNVAVEKKNTIIHEVAHYLNSIRSWSKKEDPTSYITYRSPGGINQFYAGTPEYALSTEEAQARLIDFRSNIFNSPRLMYSFLNEDENAGAKDFILSGLDKISRNEIIKKNPKIKKRYYSRLYEMYLEYKNKFDKNFKNILSNYRLREDSLSNNADDKIEDTFFSDAAKIPKYREAVKEFFINESNKPGFGGYKYIKTIMELGLEDLAKRILTNLSGRSSDSLFSKDYIKLAKHFNLEYIMRDGMEKLISRGNFSKIISKIKGFKELGILDDFRDVIRDLIIKFTEDDADNFSSLAVLMQNEIPLLEELGLADYIRNKFIRMVKEDDLSILEYINFARRLGMDDFLRELFKSEVVVKYNVIDILRNIKIVKELGLGADETFKKIVESKLQGWRDLSDWQAIAKALFNHPPEPLDSNSNEPMEKESFLYDSLLKLARSLESLGCRKESIKITKIIK